MKLDFEQFPAMKNLAADVRQKAVEFAESLGARGPRPTTVLGTAVTLAREWKSGRLPTRPISAPFLVQPRAGRWVIKRSTDEKPSHTFLRMDDAVRRAQQLAREVGAACFVFGPGGTLIERFEARAIAEMKLPKEPVVETCETSETIDSKPNGVLSATSDEEALQQAGPVIETTTLEAGTSCEAPTPAWTHEARGSVVGSGTMTVETTGVHDAAENKGDEDAGEDIGAHRAVATECVHPPEVVLPIRVKKAHGKWAVIVDDSTEVLPTRAKAIKRAFELGHKLGRQVLS